MRTKASKEDVARIDRLSNIVGNLIDWRRDNPRQSTRSVSYRDIIEGKAPPDPAEEQEARKQITEIGEQLAKSGGLGLMRDACDLVEKEHGSLGARILDGMWDGIGGWIF